MSSQPLPEWNPYASPRPETLDADAEPRAEPRQAAPRFGLERPIHAAGAMAPEHIAEAVPLGLGRLTTRFWLTWIGLPALLTAHFYFKLGPANTLSLAMATFTAMMFALGLAQRLSHRTVRRQLARRYQDGGRNLELVFTDDDVSVRSETCEGVAAWAIYSKCALAPSLVVLQTADDASWCPVPRSFFASQADWDLFNWSTSRNALARGIAGITSARSGTWAIRCCCSCDAKVRPLCCPSRSSPSPTGGGCGHSWRRSCRRGEGSQHVDKAPASEWRSLANRTVLAVARETRIAYVALSTCPRGIGSPPCGRAGQCSPLGAGANERATWRPRSHRAAGRWRRKSGLMRTRSGEDRLLLLLDNAGHCGKVVVRHIGQPTPSVPGKCPLDPLLKL